MFKVGDKVRRIKEPNSGNGVTLEVGTVASVVKVCADGWLTLRAYEKMGPSNPRYFELVKPEPQAAAIAGGLQEHSVGEYYPLAAVLYEHGDERIITIENLQTGEVAAVGNHATHWGTFGFAYSVIERVNKGERIKWTKGRVYYANERWVVAEPANPVRVTRLRNMLHRVKYGD